MEIGLRGWAENDVDGARAIVDFGMGETLRKYEQALGTAFFERTKQLLNELMSRVKMHQSRVANRLFVISQMEHLLSIQ